MKHLTPTEKALRSLRYQLRRLENLERDYRKFKRQHPHIHIHFFEA